MVDISIPVPSSTVLLLRDSAEEIEVFMVKRNAGIEFAGGALVYPGGKIDPEDFCTEKFHHCSGIGELEELEIGSRVCGIRETFEEAGFLLARDNSTGQIIDGERCANLVSEYRNVLHNRKLKIWELIEREGLTLACDLLVPFAHWITPEISPKRYDTWFYLARVPNGQIGVHDNLETVDSTWISPKTALEAVENKQIKMVFATRMNLLKVGMVKNVEEAIARAIGQRIITVEPKVTKEGNITTFFIPLEAGYGIEKEVQATLP